MEKDTPKAASVKAAINKASINKASLGREAVAGEPRSGSASSARGASGQQPARAQGTARASKARSTPRPEEARGTLAGAAQTGQEGEAPPARRTRQRQPDESRAQMLERLSNPLISLHEAGVLLQVCAATVRRLANEGELPHTRTDGGQRRFRLSDVLGLNDAREKRRSGSSRALSSPVEPRFSPRPGLQPAASSPSFLASGRPSPAGHAGHSIQPPGRREEMRSEEARAQAARERIAAMRAQVEESRRAAREQPGAPAASSASGGAPATGEASAARSPLRLGMSHLLAPRPALAQPSEAAPQSSEPDLAEKAPGKSKGRGETA